MNKADLVEQLNQSGNELCRDAAEEISRLRQTVSDLQELLFPTPDKTTEPTVERKRTSAPKFKRGTPAIERLLSRVDKGGTNGCWIWQGSGNERYGYIADDNQRTVLAHRLSFEHFNRKLRKGERVLHQCDNTWCVNPDHLRAGTQKQNMADASIRGRHGRARVTPSQALEIYTRYQAGETCTKLATEFNISLPAASAIGLGRHWHALGITNKFKKLSPLAKKEARARRQSKLTARDVRRIRQRARKGDSHKDIAADYDIHQTSVTSIVSGRRWRHVK